MQAASTQLNTGDSVNHFGWPPVAGKPGPKFWAETLHLNGQFFQVNSDSFPPAQNAKLTTAKTVSAEAFAQSVKVVFSCTKEGAMPPVLGASQWPTARWNAAALVSSAVWQRPRVVWLNQS